MTLEVGEVGVFKCSYALSMCRVKSRIKKENGQV